MFSIRKVLFVIPYFLFSISSRGNNRNHSWNLTLKGLNFKMDFDTKDHKIS